MNVMPRRNQISCFPRRPVSVSFDQTNTRHELWITTKDQTTIYSNPKAVAVAHEQINFVGQYGDEFPL